MPSRRLVLPSNYCTNLKRIINLFRLNKTFQFEIPQMTDGTVN